MSPEAAISHASVARADSNFQSFSFSIRAGVARIRLNRPEKRNCLTREFWYELPRALNLAECNPQARCVLIAADGPMFTAGIDLSLLRQLADPDQTLEASRRADYLRRTVLSLQATFNAIEECSLPVVVAVQGGCVGGGLDMICAADIRLVEKSTRLIPLEIDLGMVPDLGTVQRLACTLPPAVVNDWLMTCKSMTGEEALAFGFASRLAESKTDLEEVADEVVSDIARKSPLAIRGAKEMHRFTREYGVAASLKYTAAWQSGVFPGADMSVSLQARENKLTPEYLAMADEMNLLGAQDLGHTFNK